MTPTSTPRPFARRFAAALCGALLLAGAARANEDAKGVIQKLTSEAIAVLANKSSSTDEKRMKLQAVVYAYTDFDTMSKLVLARNWKDLSEAQQKDFTEQFKQHLSITYGKNVDSYRDEKVTILGTRDEARGDITVQTTIVRGAKGDVFVDYRLRQSNGTWKVIDVVIERVSLVSNFRSQFQDVIIKSGADGLLKLLREKNAKGESLKS